MSSERKNTFILILFNFFLGLGYTTGFFSANSLFVHHVGAQSLPQVYLASAVLSLLLSGFFYLFIRHFRRPTLIHASFFILGAFILLFWFLLLFHSSLPGIYHATRIFFYAVFILTHLLFWMRAGSCFSPSQAKKLFSYFIASEVMGEMGGSLLLQLFSMKIHTVNFIPIWGVILILFPFLLRSVKSLSTVRSDVTVQEIPGAKKRFGARLALLLFVFWVAYTFLGNGTDYLFNSIALKSFKNEDLLNAFFGQVALFSGGAVLIYQLFLARPLAKKMGVVPQVFILISLLVFGLGALSLTPSLSTAALSHGIIYFFADFMALSLFQPLLNLFPAAQQAKIRVLTEGLGRPLGVLLLLGASPLFQISQGLEKMGVFLFTLSVIGLAYPFLFQRAYLRTLPRAWAAHS